MVRECCRSKTGVSLFLNFLVLALSAFPAFAAHTSNAALEPQWSPADSQVNYVVTINNTGGDRIDEVRVYRNLTYSNFSCSPKTGWELYFLTAKQACQYVVTDSSYSINAGETASFDFSAKTPAAIECNLKWRFETRDVNEQWQYIFNTTSVDDAAPLISKVVGDPQIKVDDSTYYITQQTPITLSAYDPPEDGQRCPSSGIKYCRYRYTINETGYQSGWIDWTDHAQEFTFTFPEDSTHKLEVECADNAGNVATLTETDYVDTVAPHTDKTYGQPSKIDGNYRWITSQTPVTFSASDPTPHPAGVKEIHWRNTWLPEVPDELCVETCDFNGEGVWNITPGDHATIYKPEDSCHLIEFYAVDNLNNEEQTSKQCVFVDNQPPEGSKVIGEPKVVKTTGTCTNVTNGGGAGSDVPVGSVVHQFNVSTFPYPGYTNGCSVGLAFDGTSLYYNRCGDENIYKFHPVTGALQGIVDTNVSLKPNAMAYDSSRNGIWFGTQGCSAGSMPIYFWDFDDGSITQQFSVPPGLINPATGESFLGYCFLDGLAFNANGPGAADDELWFSDDVNYNLGLFRTNGSLVAGYDSRNTSASLSQLSGLAIGGQNLYMGNNGGAKIFRANKDTLALVDQFVSTHERLEDMECDPVTFAPTEVMWVRHTPQDVAANDLITAFAIEPGTCGKGGEQINCTQDTYVTTNTNITLSCNDPIPHPVHFETVFWQFSNHDGENWSYSDWFSSTQLPVTVRFNEDSYHDLTYYCKDGLGNTGKQDKEYFYVETVPPVINKTVLGPQYAEVGTCPPQSKSDKCYIVANDTTIHVEVTDPQPHPVDGVKCEWSYTLDGNLAGGARELTPPFDITFPEDSTHVLTIKCEDALHNPVVDEETFLVDAKPPVTTKTYGQPYDNSTGREYMNSDTYVTLKAVDEKVGHIKTYYLNTLLEGEGQLACEYPQTYCHPIHDYNDEWTLYQDPFTKTPESCHMIEYWSEDKLGNKEPIRAQCVYVDNSYPNLTKTVGEPKFPCEAPGSINTSCTASRTYTLNADFDEGTLIGLEHTTVADQLQIDQGQVSTFPLLWVANAGEDSLSKWDTNTNKELARYHTWFGALANHGAWSGPAPSRTAVDADGNAYVANRHFDGKPANVFKILADDWIDRNGNGVMDTSYDANNDGTIQESEMLPMNDTNGNGVIDDNEIKDERIAWVATVGPSNGIGRSLAIDLDGNIWLGLWTTQQYYKLSGVNGSVLGGPYSVGNNPYGALIDKYGILWGASLGSTLLRLDTNNPANTTTYYHGNYGSNYGIALGYDAAGSTQVYLGGNGYTYIQFNSSSKTFSVPAQYYYYTNGISTDSEGNIIAGRTSGGDTGSVSKFAPNGTRIWYAPPQQSSSYGVAVDSNDDVWLIHEAISKLTKFSGVNGSPLGVFNSGLYPYTYSDATGLGFRGSVSSGTWTVVFDSAAENTTFGAVDWNSYTPEGTSIKVEIRSSNDQASWSPWETVSNGVPPSTTPPGRYLEVKVTLKITSGETSPILYDLSVKAASCGEAKPDCWWVRDHVTPVTLDCTDQIPHPVGGEQACYKVSYDLDPDGDVTDQYCEDNGGQMEDGWCCADVSSNPYTFDFTEDSWHNLTFFCRDKLGNTNPVEDFEYFRVDSTPPTTTQSYGGAHYVNEDGADYIDTASWIDLTAVDGGQHCAVGDVKTYWQNLVYTDENEWYCQSPENCEEWDTEDLNPEGWNLYNGSIYKKEESCHVLAYYSVDKLGNQEKMQWKCFFVDKKPPITDIYFSGPQYENDTAMWINSSTVISITATDPQPHPSGVNYTKSRYAIVDDAYCRDKELCSAYEGTIDKEYDTSTPKLFSIPEESCHLIEYYSVDNVEKTETPVNRRCVFVDNTPPKPVKTVGEPKSTWSGNDSKFYPWIKDRCWNRGEDQIDCWKVTILTPVSLGCEDQGQHPVDHSTISFNINLDNMTDITGEYCNEDGIDGYMEDGFCHVDREAPITLYFGEESEHNLKYYCTDALGNQGPIDEEKFKVEGTAFDLSLHKKWNLISVPFVLLNDDPADVFKEVKDNITAVWSYDNGVWSVWTPNGGPQSLQHIKPGWGYWVLSNADAKIQIGGALFSPITTPPDRQLVKGWNFIGYYGTDWQEYGKDDEGPSDGQLCPDDMSFFRGSYCSLISLVNTQQGYPKWGQYITTYRNCGGDDARWKFVTTPQGPCPSLGEPDERMFAGKGYWIDMDEPDLYAPI